MSIKRGFGTRRQLFTSGGDLNIVIQLIGSPKNVHHIQSLTYSYGLDSSAPSAQFQQGRLVIAKGKFQNTLLNVAIDSSDQSIVANDSSFDTLFDHTVSLANGYYYFGEGGIVVGENQDVFALLSAPSTVGDMLPAFDNMIGALTMCGVAAGLPDPYPNAR